MIPRYNTYSNRMNVSMTTLIQDKKSQLIFPIEVATEVSHVDVAKWRDSRATILWITGAFISNREINIYNGTKTSFNSR